MRNFFFHRNTAQQQQKQQQQQEPFFSGAKEGQGSFFDKNQGKSSTDTFFTPSTAQPNNNKGNATAVSGMEANATTNQQAGLAPSMTSGANQPAIPHQCEPCAEESRKEKKKHVDARLVNRKKVRDQEKEKQVKSTAKAPDKKEKEEKAEATTAEKATSQPEKATAASGKTPLREKEDKPDEKGEKPPKISASEKKTGKKDKPKGGKSAEGPATGQKGAPLGGKGPSKSGEKTPSSSPAKGPAINAADSKSYVDSLAQQSPTGFIQGMQQSGPAISQINQKESEALKASMPVMEQPTGLPVLGEAKPTSKKEFAKKEVSQESDKSDKGQEKVPEKHQESTVNPIAANSPTPKPKGENDEGFKQNIQRAVQQLPTSDSVTTDPGIPPEVQLTGATDPNQNQQKQEEMDTKVASEQTKADQSTTADFGENAIFPGITKETLTSNAEVSPPLQAASLEEGIPETTAEIKQNFDAEAQAHLNQEMAPELSQHDAEYQKKESEQQAEREKTDMEIEAETDRVRTEQETIQNQAKADVNTQREAWRAENEAVKKDYQDKSTAEKQKVDQEIDTKVEETDQQIAGKYESAQKEADAEAARKEAQAREMKRKAEEESKNKSWWDRAVDAVSDFFDSLKEGLNALFDGLRAFVKAVIEAAKKFANDLIDLARDFIVNAIQAFGEVLKGLVSVVFAAFPEIAKRINGLIDQAVDVAVSAVNALAEGLKKAVNALLDALGWILDKILAAYQAYLNLLLDALKLIAVGILIILKGLANLGMAAVEMPGQFMGQVTEEFLGMNLYEPLAFEKTEPTQVPDAAGNPSGAADGAESEQEYNEFAQKKSFNQEDFKVDPVPNDMEIEPELAAQVPEGGEVEFGENSENTVDGLKADVMGGAAGQNPQGEAAGSETAGSGGETATPQGTAAGMSDRPTDPKAQVDWFIAQQDKMSSGSTPDSAEGKEPAGGNDFPEEMKIGPLTPGLRFYYLRQQMWKGITKKWEENKWTYIGIGAAVVLGITALAIATAGAIFGLIPPALQIFAAIMMGAAALKAADFFKNYLVEGWPGNLIEAAKGLARAIAIILVELIFILLFDLNTLLKVLKSGVKGAIKMAAQGVKNTAKALATSFKAIGKGLVKQGKRLVFFFKGVGKGIGKGVKKFSDFGKRLLKRFKFRKFKLVRKGRSIRLMGYINPWILLAEGKLEKIDPADLKKMDGDGALKVGDMVKYGQKEGLVVGSHGTKVADDITSAAVKEIDSLTKTAKIAKFRELKKMDIGKRIKQLTGGSSVPRNPMFRPNFFKFLEKQGLKLSEEAKRFLSIHHVVPNALKGSDEIVDFLKQMKFNIDEVMNAIALPRTNLKNLDEVIKVMDDVKGTIDDAMKSNADEMLKYQDDLAKIVDDLGLPPNTSMQKVADILDELKAFKSSSIHDSYHNAYNSMIKKQIQNLMDDLARGTPVEDIKSTFDQFLGSLKTGLENGTINLK